MAIPCTASQKLTMRQFQDLARRVGWPENLIITISAIAKQESSLCPKAINRVGELSVGLLQINMRAHGTRYGTLEQLYDPATNLRAGLAIYRMQGLKAWGAYTHPKSNPAYLKYMPEARAAYSGSSENVVLVQSQNQVVSNQSQNQIVPGQSQIFIPPQSQSLSNSDYLLLGGGLLLLLLL